MASVGFVQESLGKVLTKLQTCLERPRLLGSAFSSFHILRSCLSARKVTFLLHTLLYTLAVVLASESPARIL